MKKIENTNTTKANATRGNVYAIHKKHTNKYIDHFPDEPTTISMRDKRVSLVMRMHIHKLPR